MNIFYTGWIIFIQDFHLRYRRAALGFFWFFLPALIGGGALITASLPFFQHTANPQSFGTIHILINLLIFQSFVDGMTAPIQMLRRTRLLTRDTPVQPGAILAASLYMGLFTLATRLPLFFVAEYFFFNQAGTGWIYAQGYNMGLLFLGLIPGAILAPLSMVMLDFRFGLPFIQGFFLLITPVLYPVVQNHVWTTLQTWNPLAYLLLNSQSRITHHSGPALSWPTAITAGLCLLFFSYSAYFFHKTVKRIPDNL